jgi:transposase
MIPAGASVFVATQPVDFREGASGLAALVRDSGADPFSGALYVFCSKRADRVKIVWWDGTVRYGTVRVFVSLPSGSTSMGSIGRESRTA